MMTPHRSRFVLAQIAWLLGTVLFLAVMDAFSYGLFILLSVLGLVVVADVVTLSRVRPRWEGRLRTVVAIGLGVAAVVIGVRLLQLFAPGAIP